MPAADEHRRAAREFLNYDSSALDKWMDEGPGGYGSLFILHRLFRHDPVTTAKEAEKIFGPGAGDAVKLHVLLDDTQAVTVAGSVAWAIGLLLFGYGALKGMSSSDASGDS